MYTSLSTTKEMATHLKDHAKFPLGRNVYATVGTQNGKIQVNILKYKVLKSLFHPTVLAPTQFGVTLNENQFQQLINNAPLVVSEMSSLAGSSTDSSSEIVQRPSMSSKPNQPTTTSIPQVYVKKTTTPNLSMGIVQRSSPSSTTKEPRTTSSPRAYVEKTSQPVKILPKPTDLGDKAVTRPLTNVPRPASLRLKKKAASKDPWRTILLDHPLPLKKRRVRSPSKHRKQQTNTKSVDKKRLMNNTKTEPKCLINDTKPAICCPGEAYDVPTQEIQELGADIAPNHEVDDHEYPTETL